MPKRFTDTDKWKKQWIRSLSPDLKLAWLYILDDCDIAGLWHVDWEVLQIRLGISTDITKAQLAFSDHIVILDDGSKWFVPSFIEFQYGTELSKSNNIYKSIAKILDKYDLYRYLTIEITDSGTTVSSFRNRISKKTKDRIFLEADMTCQYCQERKSIFELVVDHFVPLFRGGDNSDDNLICSCVRCNSHKTDLMPDEFLSRNLQFLNPTQKIISLSNKLKGAFSDLTGPKDKDKDKVIGQGNGKGQGEGQSDDPDFSDYEEWTKAILSGNDWLFNDKVRNMNIPVGERIGEICTSHLALLAKYPKMKPTDQNKFRISLIGHIQEKLSEASKQFKSTTVKKLTYQELQNARK